METYWIRTKDGVVEVTKEVALTNKVYGIKKKEGDHTYEYHNECDNETCPVCNLSVCLVCGAYEGGLTTECCGEHLNMDDIDDIYQGKKDFRYGKWIEGVINIGMTNDFETVERNRQIILTLFKEEVGNKTELGVRVVTDLSKEEKRWEKYKKKD